MKSKFLYRKDYSDLEICIKNILNSKKTSEDKFEKICKEFRKFEGKLDDNKGINKTDLLIKEIKLNLLYPRLDINVSKHLNHLLKAPFCIHPKTGLISVPMSQKDFYNFDRNEIPNFIDAINDHKNKR